ncbi:MAG: hypothetical protein Q7S22_01120, partial [Candidatus Micrarchaeota archaeon]|nr:hypothetical protein [Candidatus Micrarchaeota archaeon]
MQFTQKTLAAFKQNYLKVFGEELSDDEVRRKAEYLVEVYRSAYGVPSIEKFFDKKIENEET